MKKVKCILISALVCTLVSAVLLALSALIVSKTALPQGAMLQVITTLLCGICAYAGGYVASMLIREKGMLCGFLTAAVYVFLLSAISVALGIAPACNGAMVGKVAVILISGAIGGILSANRKERVKF